MVISLLVGAFLGWLMGMFYPSLAERRARFMVAGLLGAWMGNFFWSSLGPSIYGFAPIPTFLVAGALIALAWFLVNASMNVRK